MADLWTGLVGIIGVLIGIGVTEWLRRRRRIELFTASVFDKRLAAYEELLSRLHSGYEIATDVMENPNYSEDQRHELISGAIANIALFAYKNELFLDAGLSEHCVAGLIGAEDIFDIQDNDEKEQLREIVITNYENARRMIREDSGIAEIDKYFKVIAKPSLNSPIIDQIKYLTEHTEELGRLRKNDT